MCFIESGTSTVWRLVCCTVCGWLLCSCRHPTPSSSRKVRFSSKLCSFFVVVCATVDCRRIKYRRFLSYLRIVFASLCESYSSWDEFRRIRSSKNTWHVESHLRHVTRAPITIERVFDVIPVTRTGSYVVDCYVFARIVCTVVDCYVFRYRKTPTHPRVACVPSCYFFAVLRVSEKL